ncbi:translocation/assembly module TamB domain-containing protein [Mesobacterium pallidum]|uniref:translocation/assembly module TamB domain-containing protein n=1 Tax=Mesobacterium pallidum TaxID=2872037 RepID=UPI001EE2040C|nr:translocation/assembly module TamB domain-containing protein [Mesobacterium pallidum]
MTRRRSRLTTAALALACAAPLFAQTQSEEDDKDFLTRLLQDSLSGAGRAVTIDGFRGALSSRATIDRMTISDDEGVWLTITDVVLDWNRAALLRARLEVNEFSAGSIELPRLPQTEPAAPDPEASSEPFALPDLPVSIRIDALDADRISLGQSVLGQAAAFSLNGAVQYNDDIAAATLDLVRLDGVRDGTISLEVNYTPDGGELLVDLTVAEDAGGIAASALNLPGRPSVALTLAGEGLVSDFDADIRLETNGAPRVIGQVGLTEENGRQGFTFDLGGDLAELLPPVHRPYFEGGTSEMAATGFRDPDGSLTLENLSISAPSLALTGALALGPDQWPTRIALQGQLASEDARTAVPFAPDVTVGRATLDLTYDSTTDSRFDGSFTIEAPQVPGFAAEGLTLTTTGTLTPGDGTAIGQLGADIALTAQGLSPEDPALAQALGREIEAGFRLDLSENAPIRISGLDLQAAGMALSGDITMDRAEGANLATSVTAQLVADDLARFSALSGLDLSGGADLALSGEVVPLTGAFDLAATGTTTDLATGIAEVDGLLTGTGQIDVRAVRDTDGLRLERATVSTSALDATANAAITSQGTAAQFDATLNSIAAALPGSDGAARATGSASVSPEGVPSALDANISLVPGTSGMVVIAVRDTPVRAASGEVTVALDPTQRVVYSADMVDLSYGDYGADSLRALGTAQIDASPMSTRVDVIAQGLSETLADLIGPEAEAGATLTFAPEGLVVSDGRVVAQSLSGTAAARLPSGGPITFRAEVESPNLAQIPALASSGVGGATTARIEGSVDGGTTRIRLDGTGRDLAVAAASPGTLLPGETEFGTNVVIDGTGITVSDASVSHADISVDANAALPTGGPITFAADIASDDLGALAPLAANGVGGGLTARVTGSVDSGTTEVRLDGTARDLSVATVAPGPLLPGAAQFGTSVRIDAGGIAVSDAAVSHPDISVTAEAALPTGAPITFAADVSARNLGALAPLAATGVSGGTDARIEGSIADGTTRLNINGTATNLSAGSPATARLLAGTARFDTAVAIGPEGIAIDRAEVSHPNLTASASGTPASISFDARLRDLALLAPDFPGPLSASGTVRQTGNGTALDIDATGPGGARVSVAGTPGQSLSASGNAPLGLLNPFLAPRLIAGEATFDLRLNGPVDPANLTGSINTRGARLTDPGLGQALSDIDAAITLAGGSARVDLRGNLVTGGIVSITGPVGLSAPYNARLDIGLLGLSLRDNGLYEADLGGILSVRGPLTGGAEIGGRIEVNRAEIQVPSTGMTALGEVPPIRHVGASSANAATRAKAGIEQSDGRTTASDNAGGGGFPVNLRIIAPGRIFVRGRGLDAELGGELRLGGTTSDVIPGGRFDLIRGRLDILGQRFELTEGSAQLVGDFDPYLRLVATTFKADAEVSVVVEGPASAPEIRFESSPELPQDEVLALLLFSKSITSLSPFQAVQLAGAVATLAGRGGGGVIGRVRESFALDDLDVTTDEDGNAAVRAGKYISDNVYTDVTVGADGTSEINLNLDVSRNVTVKAGQSSDGNSSLGIFFEKDY